MKRKRHTGSQSPRGNPGKVDRTPAEAIGQAAPAAPVLLRSQVRALEAYKAVSTPGLSMADYKTAVCDFGASVLRSGLAAAVATLERKGSRGIPLLEHLAAARIPGLVGVSAASLPGRVRALSLDEYILATREVLQVVTWLKRAAEAQLVEEEGPDESRAAH